MLRSALGRVHVATARRLSTLPKRVRVYEVGPRDGLQNEASLVDTATKVRFINLLSATGVSAVEPTAFVHPKWVPQMADHSDVMASCDWVDGVDYPVLVPNMKGFHNAVARGARTVAVIAMPSETFARKNLNCSAAESVTRAEEIARAAAEQGVPCRAYVSCALFCPFEGPVAAAATAQVAANPNRNPNPNPHPQPNPNPNPNPNPHGAGGGAAAPERVLRGVPG